MPGCHKTEKDGAGWELRDSKLGSQLMSDRKGARPRLPGALSKASGWTVLKTNAVGRNLSKWQQLVCIRHPPCGGIQTPTLAVVEACFLPFFTKLPFGLCVL